MGLASAVSSKRNRRRGLEALARLGLMSVGISFALVGVLALMAAFHRGGARTDREGALARIAQTGWGVPILIVVALGFAGYAAWRFVLSFTGERVEDQEKKNPFKRIGYAARGVFYAGLTVATVRLLINRGGGASGNSSEQAATVLRWPGGSYIVGAAGFAFLAAGIFNGYRAVTGKYKEQLKMWKIPAAREALVTGVTAFGLMTRMLLFGIIGWFLLRTAIENDPDKAIGLDGALQQVASRPYGRVLLCIVSVGLLAYAAFRMVEARYRKV